MISYNKFKKQVKLDDDKMIGALFYIENYQAVRYKDNDESEFAIGYIFEKGVVKDGYFFYSKFGVAIEMTSNSIWCWMTQAIHGIAKLDLSEGGNRYTAAITLTKKTAIAIKKESEFK